jgi:Rps23 Pro-64 3,4-dihydroxylase Tpa1-like proline 4-hydroxylase
MPSSIIIKKHYEPFPFLQIENFYDEDELELIWQELDFLSHPIKLNPPQKTGSARDKNNIILKNNSGILLEECYIERKLSNILYVNRKLFSKQITDNFSDLSFGYEELNRTNDDRTLISYYENGGYYKPHMDDAIYTAVTWFFREPKHFIGGDFYFCDYNYKIEIQNNMTVIFPSFVKHSVDEIILNEDIFTGNGRYCMTQFMYHTGDKNATYNKESS